MYLNLFGQGIDSGGCRLLQVQKKYLYAWLGAEDDISPTGFFHAFLFAMFWGFGTWKRNMFDYGSILDGLISPFVGNLFPNGGFFVDGFKIPDLHFWSQFSLAFLVQPKEN